MSDRSISIPDDLLERFVSAVQLRNGTAFSELFTPDAVYHDCFYGDFVGREAIALLIDDWFYRTADDFRWTFHDPVRDSTTLYARFAFSYHSTIEGAPSRRVGFEGVSIMRIKDGLIREYNEVANVGPLLASLNFPPERIAKTLLKADRHIWASEAFAAHLDARAERSL